MANFGLTPGSLSALGSGYDSKLGITRFGSAQARFDLAQGPAIGSGHVSQIVPVTASTGLKPSVGKLTAFWSCFAQALYSP